MKNILIVIVGFILLSLHAPDIQGEEQTTLLPNCHEVISRLTENREPKKIQRMSGIIEFTFIGFGKIYLADPRAWRARPGVIFKDCQVDGLKLMISVLPTKT